MDTIVVQQVAFFPFSRKQPAQFAPASLLNTPATQADAARNRLQAIGEHSIEVYLKNRGIAFKAKAGTPKVHVAKDGTKGMAVARTITFRVASKPQQTVEDEDAGPDGGCSCCSGRGCGNCSRCIEGRCSCYDPEEGELSDAHIDDFDPATGRPW